MIRSERSMLQTEHDAASYAKPTFRKKTPERRSYREVLTRAVAMKEIGVHIPSIDLHDSGAAGLDDFLRQQESTRHELMLRRVRGESLSPVEDLVLRTLNDQVEAHLSKPERRPADVTAAVEEARLILAQLEDADR